jgi:hypothetical protein
MTKAQLLRRAEWIFEWSEPVGYFNANSDGKWEQSDSNDGVPFFAATQQQRKPLTDEQFQAICNNLSRQGGWDGDGWDLALKEAIEAAHGIKE